MKVRYLAASAPVADPPVGRLRRENLEQLAEFRERERRSAYGRGYWDASRPPASRCARLCAPASLVRSPGCPEIPDYRRSS
jgi:hypothetical protein